MSSHVRFFLCAAGAALLLCALPAVAAATTFEVNTTKDAEELPAECGPGGDETCLTLREAIEQSNLNDSPEADTITFGALPAGQRQIVVEGSSLPSITREVTIDGDTAPGASGGVPGVEIVAGDLGEDGFTTGLKVHEGTGTRIEGFAIGGFEAGIEVGPAESEESDESSTDTQICGNYLGVKLDGTTTEPNVTGVEVWSPSEPERPRTTQIGGAGCAGNAISGNSSYGVLDDGLDTTIAGNRIGFGPEPGDLEMPNGTNAGEGGAAGIRVETFASGGMIGGTVPGGNEANLIWFNDGPGVWVEGSAGEVSIRQNSFMGNQGLGIEIVGGTPPAPPVVSAVAEPARQSFKVEGTVTGTVGESVELEFFGSPTCDPSGSGEGQTYLGSAVQPIEAEPTHYEFVLPTEPPADDTAITATQTREAGATSEFSECASYVAPQTFTVTTTEDAFHGECTVSLCSLRDAIGAANATPSVDTIDFGVAGRIKPDEEDLPALTEPVTIDGTSAPGYAGTPLVEVDGTEALNEGPTEGISIGVGADGSTVEGLAITDFEEGVVVDANHSVLDRDTVAHNQELGIFVSGDAPATSIRRSEIFDDGGSPIEFETPNAVPAPILESFVAGPANTIYNVPVEGLPTETYAIDVFANAQCEPSEFGPAEVLLASGEVTTGADGKGRAVIHEGRALAGIDAESFTATATETATGTTSEIGHCARTQPEAEIETAPPATSPASKATFTFSGFSYGHIASYECSLDAAGFAPCASPQEYTGLADGSHTFKVRAVTNEGARDAVPPSYTWKVDTSGPISSITAAPPATTESTTAGFEFGAPGATGYECSLDGGGYAPCASPQSFSGLAPGKHSFAVRATGEGGNTGRPAVYEWTVSNPPSQQQQAQASAATPPAEEPTPTNGEKVVVQPEEGKVLIKLPGSKKFVPLEELKEIPVGAVIDATKGKVLLTSIDPDGTEQSANFFGGVFKVKQREGAGLVVLELLDTTACPAPRSGGAPRLALASSLAARPGAGTAGKLWGSGHGNFRTEGNNGSATVRGTIWLVEDRCNGTTFFRTRRGIVTVRDFTTHKTLPLPAGKTYVAGEG